MHGTDVAGNVCGRKNTEKVPNVSQSGQDLEDYKYLYFDILKTAKMLGDDTLAEAISESSLSNQLGSFDKNKMSNRDYCLSGAYASSVTSNVTKKLLREDDAIIDLSENSFQSFEAESQTDQENLQGIVLSARLISNNSKVVVLLEEDGEMKVWRTAQGCKLTIFNKSRQGNQSGHFQS